MSGLSTIEVRSRLAAEHPYYAAYAAKPLDDEIARRRIEGVDQPPTDGWCELTDRKFVPGRTMEEWCDATPVELLDGPLVIHFGDYDDEFEEDR